jgi:hypothetical protein
MNEYEKRLGIRNVAPLEHIIVFSNPSLDDEDMRFVLDQYAYLDFSISQVCEQTCQSSRTHCLHSEPKSL